MKLLLILTILVLMPVGLNSDINKFKVEFTIIYNKMTLAEAAEMEAKLTELYSDACTIKIALNPLPDADPNRQFLLIHPDSIEYRWR